MNRYNLIITLISALFALSLAGCGKKSDTGNGASPTAAGDVSKNDLITSRTCSGNPPAGRTILNKWSFRSKSKGASFQTDLNIAGGMTNISVTCTVGNQTKILSDSVPSHIINSQYVISDYRNQSEMVGKTPCVLSVAAQTWNFTLNGNCLTLSSGGQSRTWVNTN